MLRGSYSDARNPLLHAAAALAVGACVYCFVRTDPMWLLPGALHAPVLASPWLAALTGSLPVLAHVWAMAWLTAVVAGRESRAAAWAAPVWATVNVAFEVGQHSTVAPRLAALAQPLDGVWLLEHTGEYFTRGSFDPFDMAAALAGGATAAVLIERWRRG